ncbi:uncharacterized protein BDV17DRAFT_271618 [Aspergillus undulatus]|uniref:uncharacterized protein n=1 Tax=Aspergillus undulatus TaxID=1810928 RepID=UPI003CCDA2BA
MKSTPLLALTPLLPLSHAWTFTWRDSNGDASTERGRGPSECIVVDHAQGQLFVLDGQGEEGINMLLFSNDKCDGEPAGMATVDFTKESSVDIKGFQVVSSGDETVSSTSDEEEDSTSTNATATATGSDDEADQTFTLPTEPATTNATATATTTATDEDDQTVTLPTEPPTTTTDESTTATPTPSGDDESETTTEPTPTDTDSDSDSGSEETGTGEEDPAPTDAASSLVLSRSGLVGVAVGVVVGGWAAGMLF